MGKSIRVKKGNEVLEIQDSDLQAAVNDGYLPTERIVVANSKTKETYEIDPQDLPDALKDGFSFSDVKKKSVGQGLPMAGKAISAIGSSQSNGEVLEEGQNNTGGASSFFGGVQQSGQSQKDKVTNYLQSLKEPQKQTIEGGLTIPKKLPQVSNPFTQTREEAFEKSSGKLMDIMYKEGSDWHDPIKATHEGISKAKDTKEAVEYLGAKGLVEQSLAPDGFEALKTLQSYDFGLDAGNNITAKMLKERADKYLATTQPFRDAANKLGDRLYYGDTGFSEKEYFYDAAIKAYAEKNPNFKAQMEVAGMPSIEQNEKRGQIVDMMLNDPDFIAYATKENPSLLPVAQKVQKDLYEDNKEYAVIQIANKVSRQMQKEGYNDIDPIFNFAGENAKEFADLTAKSILTPEEYKIYQERNVFKKLDMPSFFEGFASAGKDMGKGIINSFTQSVSSVPESIKEGWVKEASHVSADPTGFTKFLRDTGHATGFVASIGAGGALGTGVGLTSQTAGAVTTALSFFGDQLEQGRMKYPNSPVKAFTSAATNTAMYSALSYQLFPATKVKQAFARIEPSVAKVVDNLTKGTISREAARAEINTLWKQGIDWLSTGLKKNIKVSAEMAGIAQLNRGLDKLMGMDDQTFEQYHPEGEVEDTAVSMFMSNILVNSLAARGDIRAKNNMAKEAIWQAANYPNRYRSVIEGMEIRGEIKSAKEMLDNLDFLVQTKSELQGKTEKQQKDYLINALQQKVLNESKPKSPDGTLTRQHSDRIKNLEEINQGILEGKDADEIVTTQEQKSLDELQKKVEEGEKATAEIESLTKDHELNLKEIDAKIKGLDKESATYSVQKEKLAKQKEDKQKEFDAKTAKLEKPSLIAKAIEAVDKDLPEYLRDIAKSDIEGTLKEAAEQLNATKQEAETARKVYGETLSDIALKLFPDAKTKVNPEGEYAKLADQQRELDMGTEPLVEEKLPPEAPAPPVKESGGEAGSVGVVDVVKEPMGDNELQQIVGRDVFKQIQRSEEQLGEGVVDRNRMIETAKRIQKADKKDKLLPEHIFEALQYETGFPDNWQDLRNAIKKGGIDINSEAVQRQIEVGVDLPKDIVEEFKKSERYKKATPELKEAVEQSLKSQTPSPIEGENTVTKPVKESGGEGVSFGEGNKFYHGSSKERVGRLTAGKSSAKMGAFGDAIYFTSDKNKAREVGKDVSEVELNILNPVYANTYDWYKVTEKAKKENISDADAARMLGYDAIVDKGSGVYGDEVAVLDESKIVYPEDNMGTKKAPERSDAEHANYIKSRFLEEFTKKGVPKEQVLAATALMDARAKSWASEEKGRTPEQWFERITDVKSGEFQDAFSDIKYQGEWKKVLIAAALAIKPLQIADTIKTPAKQEVVQTGGVKQKEVIKKLVEEYFEVNGEKAPTDVINRAIQLWDIYNKPEILSDSTAKDERAYTSGNTEAIPTSNPDLTVVVSVKGVTIGNITNFDDFIAEISHAAQYRSGGILNQRNYKYQEDRDKYEYERKGSLEYDAHKLIEPYLAKYVLTGKKGDSLIVETIKTIPKNIVDELMPTLQKYNIKFQLNKGAVEMLKDGRMIIHALDAPDFSTMVHEIAHVFESDLTKAEQKIVKEFGGSESFARGFERYLRNGIAPSKELASLFQKFRKWMMDIYKSFVGTPIEKRISPEIKKIFDRLLTEQKTKPVSEVKPEPKEIKLPEPPENYNIVNETTQASDKGNERKPTEKEVVAEPEVKEDSSGAGQEPPKTPPAEPVEGASEGKDKLNEKGILNRLYKAKNVPESAKKGFEEKGLKYQVQSQPEAQELAKGIVNEFGIEEAVTLAEANRFKGGVRSAIFAESLTRLTEEGEAAKTPEDKLRLAADFKDMAIRYDEFARGQGQDISQINYFYKKSPLGVVMYENAKRKGDFDTWSKPKDQEWKSFFDEMMKEPEFEAVVKEQVKESLKQERAEARKNRIKKVDEFFDKAKDQFKGGAAYSTIIPPKVITTALEGMKQAYRAGEKVAKLVQDAIDYITTELGNAPWDKEKFRKEWEDKLKDKSGKAPLTDAELKAKVLDRFRKKLKGLTEKQKDEVIRRAHRKLIENDALDYQDFRDIISQVVGRGDLTPEQVAQMKTMVAKLNAVETAAQRARDERTEAARIDYRRAEIEAGKASRDLNNLFYNKPDIIKRLTSIMQLNTLGIPSLVNNPIYNIWNQATLRFPVGLINDLADRGISLAAKAAGKNYDREYNVLGTQAEFWSKLGLGTKESMQQLLTGLNRQDYLQKEIYGQQIRPMSAMKDLVAYAKGEKTFNKPQLMDKAIQATAGVPAEIVARLLNIGDKPQRFAAEGSQAAAFAKTLGLADMDYKLFIDFPREEAYRAYKAQGLSDEVAGQKADYIKEAIIKEGQRSTFQQDNILNDVINAAVNKIESKVGANKDSGTGVLLKTLTISPYIKIPSNAFWSFYNLLNPEVAILQTGVHAARSKQLSKKGEITKSKLQQREARYWMAHAIVGMGMRAVVLALVKQGIFTPSSDDEESKKERDAISYFDKAGTVQVGDVKISNRWFGQWGMMGNAIAKKYRDATPEQRENQDEFWNIALGGMEVEGLKELQNGIFANSSSLLQSMDTGNPDRYLTNTLNMFANIIQPASVAQINRASLDEVPSTRGDNFLDKLNTNFAQRSTLYRKLFNVQIDSKRDIWGQTVPKGGNTLSRMFGISKANPQIFARPVYDDYLRTSDSGFLPPAVLPILEGTKLNTKQYIRLQEYVGRERKRLVEPYVNDMAMIPNFGLYSTLKDDEVKKEALSYLYTKGRELGVEKFYTDFPELRPKEKTEEEIEKDRNIKSMKKEMKGSFE